MIPLFFLISGWWHCQCLEFAEMQCGCSGYSLYCFWRWDSSHFDAYYSGKFSANVSPPHVRPFISGKITWSFTYLLEVVACFVKPKYSTCKSGIMWNSIRRALCVHSHAKNMYWHIYVPYVVQDCYWLAALLYALLLNSFPCGTWPE